jgi:hypothetical protein
MAVQRNSSKPVGITNASGQPEITLEIDGLVISMAPPGPTTDADEVTAADQNRAPEK